MELNRCNIYNWIWVYTHTSNRYLKASVSLKSRYRRGVLGMKSRFGMYSVASINEDIFNQNRPNKQWDEDIFVWHLLSKM